MLTSQSVGPDLVSRTTRQTGILYVAVLALLPVAPALGASGTALRLFLASLVAFFLLSDVLSGKEHSAPGWLQLVGIAFAALLLLAAITTPVGIAYGLARITNWLMFVPLMFLYLRRPDLPAVAVGCLSSAAIQCGGVMLQYIGVLGGTWGGALISGRDYNPLTSRWLTRYTGFVGDPNTLGLILALAIIVAAVLFVQGKSGGRGGRIVMAASLTTSIVALVLTGSRGGLLAVAIAFLILGIYAGARGVSALAGIAFTGGVWVTSTDVLALRGVTNTFAGLFNGSDSSLVQRLGVWGSYASRDISPWFGAGFGGYNPEALSGSGLDIDPMSARAATVDNSWLKLYLETGLIGVTFLLIIVAGATLAALRCRGVGDRLLGGAATAALAVIVWRSTSVDLFDINPVNAILPLALAVCLSLSPPRAYEGRLEAPRRRPVAKVRSA